MMKKICSVIKELKEVVKLWAYSSMGYSLK